ncbi:MAG: aminoacyl-tRNA hydrolase [Clostridiales bacterium]|nr:aminoacyl-tRNA hydrolase [Clostridiales bacterium]
MFLVVGLGNPGAKYAHTRHNVGFDVVDIMSQKFDIPMHRSRCKATVGEGTIAGERVALAKPETFMNLSGESVVQLVNWYKPERDGLLVIYDDIDLEAGKLRFRTAGSAGTHNGMRNIIYLLGRDDFPRLRVGTGRPPEGWDLKDWVLSGYYTPEDRKLMYDAFMNAADAAAALIRDGAEGARKVVAAANGC